MSTLRIEIAEPVARLRVNLHPRRRRNRLGQTTLPASWRFGQKYRVDVTTGCWVWTAHVGRWGYGDFRRGPGLNNQPAHRWSFEYYVRPLQVDEQVHHQCGNRKCVNPSHLEALTLDEHNLVHEKPWGLNKVKVRCKRGHLLSGENLAIYDPGQRTCRRCSALRAAAQRAAKRQRECAL